MQEEIVQTERQTGGERERENVCARRELNFPPCCLGTLVSREFLGICFYEDSSPPLLLCHNRLL